MIYSFYENALNKKLSISIEDILYTNKIIGKKIKRSTYLYSLNEGEYVNAWHGRKK